MKVLSGFDVEWTIASSARCQNPFHRSSPRPIQSVIAIQPFRSFAQANTITAYI